MLPIHAAPRSIRPDAGENIPVPAPPHPSGEDPAGMASASQVVVMIAVLPLERTRNRFLAIARSVPGSRRGHLHGLVWGRAIILVVSRT